MASITETSRASDVIDARQLWTMIYENRRIVLGVAATIFVLAMVATLGAHPEFRASGRLYLGELDERPKAAEPSSDAIDFSVAHGVVASEIEIIKSRSLIVRSVLDSGLNVAIAPAHHSAPRYWAWLLSGRDPSLVDAAAEELSASNTVFVDKFRKPRPFHITFVTDRQYEVWFDGARLGTGVLGQPLEVDHVSLTLAPGSARGPMPGAQYDIVVQSQDVVADEVLSVLQVTAPKEVGPSEAVNVVTLEFTTTSPYLASAFLERLMLAYIRERQAWKVEDAAAAEAFVSDQLGTVKGALDQIQGKLADYRSNHQMVVLDEEAKTMVEQMGRYEEQRVAARLEVAALGDIQRALKDPKAPIGAYLLGEAKDTVLDDMAAALSKARDTLIELETRFNDAAPDVRTQRAQVDAQLDSIRNYVSSRSTRSQGTLATLSAIIEQFEKKLNTVPGDELGLVQLSRQSEVYSRTYSYLLERQQQTAILKASTLSKNRILDTPAMPHKEESPKLSLRLASGPLGLLLGVLCVVSRRLFSGVCQSEGEIRRMVTGLPVFVRVPRRAKAKEQGGTSGANRALESAASEARCGFVEAFRGLRSTLYHAGLGAERKVVLVTSPCAGDGKTTCAASLAAAFAADGKSVLLIDADLRDPGRDGRSTDEEPRAGLRDVLEGTREWRDVVRIVPVAHGEISSIAAGGAARAELLSGKRMGALFSEARDAFDVVIVDAPSFPLVSDAAVLAPAADCVLSVVRLLHSSRRAAVEHVADLSRFAGLYGVIVNDAGPASSYAVSYPRATTRARRSPLKAVLSRGGSPGVRAWWIAGVLTVTVASALVVARMSIAERNESRAESRGVGHP
jgi:tyrosine-protein kinase Etk/Wzc